MVVVVMVVVVMSVLVLAVLAAVIVRRSQWALGWRQGRDGTPPLSNRDFKAFLASPPVAGFCVLACERASEDMDSSIPHANSPVILAVLC